MKSTPIAAIAAVSAAVGLVVSGCGSDTRTESATTTTTTTEAAASPSPTLAPRGQDAAGPNPTIASYIRENNIQESPVHQGDPGAPVINLPVPEGWQRAGDNKPDWAYDAIVYTGPDAGDYTPSVVALVSKLVGDVDAQKLLDLAPGEMNNLPGFEAWNAGAPSTLSDFPAFQLGGTWDQDGVKKVTAQNTVVIQGEDAVYILQLNADGLDSQSDIVGAATDLINSQTTISF